MKYNFEREFEMMQEHVKDVKDKIGELSRRFANLEKECVNEGIGTNILTVNTNT